MSAGGTLLRVMPGAGADRQRSTVLRARETRPSLDSATNALRLVEMLGTRGHVSVTDVSRYLGVGKSTAHRLLMTLVAEDFAFQDPSSRLYHAARSLDAAGLATVWDFDVTRRAQEPLEALALQIGETAKLLVLDGQFARVLVVAETIRSLRIGCSIGNLLPANATAGGKVLLAHQDEMSWRSRFGRHLPMLTPATIADWDELAVELQAVRARGWSRSVGESTPGVVGLGVPVTDRAGSTIAAVTISAPVERLPRGGHLDVIGRMLAAAAAVGQLAVPVKAGLIKGPRSVS